MPGEGDYRAKIMLIGEAPGYHEDQRGRPFVGPAGKILDVLLKSIGLNREDVYITNMVKCRPPSNRDPLPGEIQACRKYLDKQMEIVKPKVVITLGRHSLSKFFPGETMRTARAKPRTIDGTIYIPMYHPAAALHQQALRRTIEEDFKMIPQLISSVPTSSTETKVNEPKQLTMF